MAHHYDMALTNHDILIFGAIFTVFMMVVILAVLYTSRYN